MSKFKLDELVEKGKDTMSKSNKTLIYTIFLVLAIATALIAAWFAWTQHEANVKTQGKNEELEAQLGDTSTQLDKTAKELENTSAELEQTKGDLAAANDKVDLLEDSTAALNRQVSKLTSEKSELQSKVEELVQKILDIQKKETITIDQLDEQINAIGELATLRYTYTNASRKEGNLTWLWDWTMPFTDSSLLVTYDGTLKAGIDLSEIKFDVKEATRTITVTLPKSRVLDNYIPQSTINVLEVKNGLFNPVTFNDYNKFIAEETKVMEQKAIDMGLLTEADKEARSIIEAFLKGIPGADTYTFVFK